MNLTKLFNGKYLVQNIKKSKGILFVLILIVPVFTVLMLLAQNHSEYDCVVEPIGLSAINLLGMYIIPVLLSIILSGYIYKRNSVDFINSMPMNRKTIYFTNFIGGLLIITLIQVLTLITNLVCAKIFTELFIPIQMITDIFLWMLISYIFVYSATMLAQCVSGNILTQIVVTALILFLIPFVSSTFEHYTFFDNGVNLEISYDGGSLNLSTSQELSYTTPYRFAMIFWYGISELYNTEVLWKMLVLSIVYLPLGIILFNKRKMENIGTSFAHDSVHYLVKGLTLIPMVFLSCMMGAYGVYIGIVITVMFAYYIIYDFVVNKKEKLICTILCFILSTGIIFGAYKGITFLKKDGEVAETISINDIAGIGIGEIGNELYDNEMLDYNIKEKDDIEKICKNSVGEDYYNNEDILMNDYEYNFMLLAIKLKNGKKFEGYAHVRKDIATEISEKINQEEANNETEKLENIAIVLEWNLIQGEEKEQIQDILEKNRYNFGEDYCVGIQGIDVYFYNNHKMERAYFEIGKNEEIFNIISKHENKNMKEYFETKKLEDEWCNITKYVPDETGFCREEATSFKPNQKLIEYFKTHYEEPCDMNKSMYTLSIYTNRRMCFYVNENEEINNILWDNNVVWDSMDVQIHAK